MLGSKVLLTVTGLSLVAMSACAPRNSVMKAKSDYQQQAHLGVNGTPLYQTPKQVAYNSNLPGVDYTATGSIQASPVTSPPMNLNTASNNIVNTPYTVQMGDTVYSIGRKFNVKPANIISNNDMLSPDTLSVGQKIMIPTVAGQSLAASDTSLVTNSINSNNSSAVTTYPTPSNNAVTEQKYVVQSGDTLYSIGRKFNVHPKYIMSKNPNIVPNQLSPGQVLNITSNNQAQTQVKQDTQTKTALQTINNAAPKTNGVLALPVEGSIKQGDNLRGILISANDGAAVKASADGEVIYVGNLNNYGNMILVRHKNGLVTNYARLKKSFVKKGQQVSKGDLIASAGTSKDFQTSDVLFEVREGTKAVNPLKYIG